jgi:ADP-ribosylglycohydrolase
MARRPVPRYLSRVLAVRDAICGCLLGGVVGDALGNVVSPLSLAQIRVRYGPSGLSDLAPAGGRWGAATDAAKASLFTAEGLVRWALRRARAEWTDPVPAVREAALRWRAVRGFDSPVARDGWLARLVRMRAAGNAGEPATAAGTAAAVEVEAPGPLPESPADLLIRLAPLGAVLEPLEAYRTGLELASLSGAELESRVAAAALAAIVARIRGGEALEVAAVAMRDEVISTPGFGQTIRALDAALGAARSAPPEPNSVELFGTGASADEALGIGLFCALTAASFEDGVLLAVNHGGASAATGAVAGLLLGVVRGPWSIPARWLEAVELVPEVEEIAADLDAALGGVETSQLLERYPVPG